MNGYYLVVVTPWGHRVAVRHRPLYSLLYYVTKDSGFNYYLVQPDTWAAVPVCRPSPLIH